MAEDESSESSSLNNDPEIEDEETGPKTRREKLNAFLQSNPVQYGILALVVVDVIIVILEILIDFGMITIPENEDHTSLNGSSHNFNYSHFDSFDLTTAAYNVEPHALQAHPDQSHHAVHHNVTSHHQILANNSDLHNNSSDHHDDHDSHHHSNKETVEHILHYSSLSILAIFVVEVFCKLAAEGLHFFKHKAEVFDAIIVIVSFSLDIAFSFVSVTAAARDATGLMVLLRLWRVTRIVNGVIMSVKKDADKKIQEQKKARLKAEAEAENLRGRVETLQNELMLLKKKLKRQGNGQSGGNGSPNDMVEMQELECANNVEITNGRRPGADVPTRDDHHENTELR